MKSGKRIFSWFFVLLLFCCSMNAQQMSSAPSPATVPRLVNFSGKAMDTQGEVIPGNAGATGHVEAVRCPDDAVLSRQYLGQP